MFLSTDFCPPFVHNTNRISFKLLLTSFLTTRLQFSYLIIFLLITVPFFFYFDLIIFYPDLLHFSHSSLTASPPPPPVLKSRFDLDQRPSLRGPSLDGLLSDGSPPTTSSLAVLLSSTPFLRWPLLWQSLLRQVLDRADLNDLLSYSSFFNGNTTTCRSPAPLLDTRWRFILFDGLLRRLS